MVTKATLPAQSGKTYHKVPLALNLPVGKYTIGGRIVQREGGRQVAAAEGILDIMANGPGFAAFDEDNTLIVEGEPYLVLGIYHPRDKQNSYEGFKDVANVGFNVVNIFGWMGVGRLNLLRPVDAFCLWEQLPHRGPVMAMEQSWALHYHPSALINYTMDEPPESRFAFVRELDEAWRKYDPYHPTYLASYQPHHFRRNAEISDILAPDPYPYSAAKGDDSDLALVARRVELARAASDGVNPVFCVPQAFGSEPVPIWRNMALQAIVHGAKGIIWYAWNEGNPKAGGMVYNDELVAAAEVLLAQLKLLASAILGDAENQPRMFTAPPGGEPVSDTLLGSKNVPRKNPYDDSHTLHGMVCRDPKAGTRYLFLVNSSKEPLKMDLPLPEAGKLTGINGAFDDSVIRLEDGVARIELGKFGSGIWYWDGPRPVMPRPMSDFAVRKLPARASGKTWTVAPAGGTHTNLQQAIDAAGDGDVIRVAEGNWGRIVSDNKLIDIVATGDRGKTVISGNRNRAATLTQRYQGDMAFETNTLIRGFTIQNGDSTLDAFRPKFGGGVIGGTLVDCVVQNNKARYGGGAAFVNASRDNYQLTLAAPFIDAGRDTFFSRDESDFYGNRRVSGAGAEPGAAELPMSLQPIYEFDVAQANPLASSAVKLSLLVNTGREQPLPEVSREALVFDGKTSSARARSSIPDIGGSRWPRYRWEVEFRTQDKGPIFTIGDALTVAVTPKGKLNITSIIGGRPARTNVIESAGNVRGRNFNKLVIETDTFGGPQAAVTATLNGKPLPVKTGWDSIGFFNFGRNPAPTFGTCKSEYFKGEVKSFRLTGFAD